LQVYRRRVQIVGGGTLTVGLPKDWSRDVGLKPGSEVIIEVLPDKTLRLYPGREAGGEEKTYSVNVASEPDANVIVRRVMAGYIAGYNVIKLVGRSKVNDNILNEALNIIRNKTIGLEVIDEDLDTIVLQSIVDTGFAKVRDVVRRLVRIALSMHEDVLSCLKGVRDCDTVSKEVRERDDIADKLYLLLVRQLVSIVSNPREAERQQITPSEALFLTLIAKNIERIGDYASNIVGILGSHDEIPGPLVDLYTESINLLKDTASILLKGSSQALDLLSKADKLKQRLMKARESSIIQSTASRLIIETISRILGHTMDILEAIMDIEAVKQARHF
jgi:phosphate uptake regulator